MTDNTISFVFPGQGSQFVGMLADMATQYDEIQKIVARASAALGYDLWALMQDGPTERLDKTTHTQPALLAASYALWCVIHTKQPIQPKLLAGHSLGEYTALVCADAIQFEDAIKLVAARGQYMQEAVPVGEGAMAAIIGLDESAVISLCQEVANTTHEIVSPANFNSLGQTVVAGQQGAVLQVISLAKEQGAKLAQVLPVSVPSHCALMRPAAERLAKLLNEIDIQPPKAIVLSNVDVKPYTAASDIRDGLIRQLYSPVRWVETIQAFVKSGITEIVECGPGKVLTGLNKRIDKNLRLSLAADYISTLGGITSDTDRLA